MIDRLWPRGVSKEQAALDVWLKEIAPSTNLRSWFNHQPARFIEFSHKYIDELSHNPATTFLEQLVVESGNITLLYAAKDPTVNHAVILKDFLEMRNLRSRRTS